MAAILSLVSVSVSAEPIVYTFEAAVSVSKFDVTSNDPLSAERLALWFPSLANGGTYSATGFFVADPSLLGEGDWRTDTVVGQVTVGEYTWAFNGDEGYGAVLGSMFAYSSFPTITNGYMPNDSFFGRDGRVSLSDIGGSRAGSIWMWGTGTDPGPQPKTTALLWSGTMTKISVPEPGTLSLLLLGAPFVSRRRLSRS